MKYEFTGETKDFAGITLRQIRYTHTGEIGGWIEKEANLSNSGHARVCGNAQVYGNALVCSKALVSGDARVCGDARVYASPPLATRSDGYHFAIFTTRDGLRITAGCRFFTVSEAREHWTRTRGGTPLGAESLAIVDHLERMAAIVFAETQEAAQ